MAKMRWMDIFRKRKGRRTSRPASRAPALKKVHARFDQLQAQLATIDIVLRKHDEEISENSVQISRQMTHLQNLEQKVCSAEGTVATSPLLPLRPSMPGQHGPPPSPIQGPDTGKLDFHAFTAQEKRLLAVFFQDRGMPLSYIDLARALGKSPNTIKNQMNRLRRKTDLFDYTTGDQGRNRFRLKPNLRIENYLQMDRPVHRPASPQLRQQSTPPDYCATASTDSNNPGNFHA